MAGDFHAGRSDVDLVAVITHDPTATTVATLANIHDVLVREHPEWVDRVEVDYVSPKAVVDVISGTGQRHSMARISPGEPLHLTEASRHYLLNWHSAVQHDYVLVGSPPSQLLPRIGVDLVRQVVLAHVEQWSSWVLDMRTPGAQAYAVLTICRAAASLETGRHVSKRAAAAYGVASMPESASLIEWARDWWYAEGSDEDPDCFPEVVEFVRTAAARIVQRHR